VPVPHLDADVDWPTYAETFKQRICQRLEETMLPGLRDKIVTSRLLTPQDFQDRLNSFKGAGFGFEPRITQSAWFRPHNRSEDIEGLHLVGAGTHPGAGMPAVISSAKVIDQLIPAAVPHRA
jgi:phytoene desaturase